MELSKTNLWKQKILPHLNESFVDYMLSYIVDEIQGVLTHHPLLKFDDQFYDHKVAHWVFMPPPTQTCMGLYGKWRVGRLLIDIHAKILSIPLEKYVIDIDSWLNCTFILYYTP